MNIYDPVVLGPGITITEAPSSPNHGARLKDVHEYATMQVVAFTDALELTVPKRPLPCIIQVFDTANQAITPNILFQVPNGDTAYINFIEPQSGTVLIFTVGTLP